MSSFSTTEVPLPWRMHKLQLQGAHYRRAEALRVTTCIGMGRSYGCSSGSSISKQQKLKMAMRSVSRPKITRFSSGMFKRASLLSTTVLQL